MSNTYFDMSCTTSKELLKSKELDLHRAECIIKNLTYRMRK
jgi:hypothetical protein